VAYYILYRKSPDWRPPDLTAFYVDVGDFRGRKLGCMRAHESQLRYMTKDYIEEHFEVECEAYYSRGEPPQLLRGLQGSCLGPLGPTS
jgi:LmbE family N-acetylglucosaminyl deacetylase